MSKRRVDWKGIDASLRAGLVEGVPAGTDLEEFLWQTKPESRAEVEARNPGRTFKSAAWGKTARVLDPTGGVSSLPDHFREGQVNANDLWRLVVGLSFAIEALGREVGSQELVDDARAMLNNAMYEHDPPEMVKDRFAKFTQDCRLTPEETDDLRKTAFPAWVRRPR